MRDVHGKKADGGDAIDLGVAGTARPGPGVPASGDPDDHFDEVMVTVRRPRRFGTNDDGPNPTDWTKSHFPSVPPVPDPKIRKLPVVTNAERRREFAATLVGKTVEVVALGGVPPHKDPTVLVHLPLPEYGIALRIVATPTDVPVNTGGNP